MSETLNERAEREAREAFSDLPPPPQLGIGVKVLGVLGILAIVLYALFLVIPQDVPLLDANRNYLATSRAEGYCAGIVFGETRGYGSEAKMQDCIEYDTTLPKEQDLDKVQGAFCDGLYASAGFPTDRCREIVRENKLWPTMEGLVTQSWNRKFPYPGSSALDGSVNSGDPSRTGDRVGNSREDITR